MLVNINEILHPTDFSRPAQNAFNYAREIAQKVNSKKLSCFAPSSPHAYGSYGLEIRIQVTVYDKEYKDLQIDPAIEFGFKAEITIL